MIKQIYLKNFVLFEEQEITFNEHSNGLVGETGAGKSVIFSAINVLCGQRNLKKLIMKNKDYYELEIIIGLKKINFNTLTKINKILNSNLTNQDDIKVYRRLDINSKSIIRINNENYTLLELKEIMKYIIDLHIQDATNEILKEENHINIIDELLDKNILFQYEEMYQKYEKQKKIVRQLNEIDKNKDENLEILNFKLEQLQEIKNLESEEVLQKQRLMVEQSQKIKKNNEIVQNSLNKIYSELEVIRTNDDFVQIPGFNKKISDMYYQIEDLSFEHAKNIDLKDEIDIDNVLESLDLLKRLQRKYNLDYEGLVLKYDELVQEKEKVENISFEIIKEEKILKDIENSLLECAKKLSGKRKEIADSLVSKVNENFSELQMANAQIKISIDNVTPNNKGIDTINILLKTNKGHDFEPINQIASGGEKSRVMLILKIVFNEYNPKLVYLLDEIDQGISSVVAKMVGVKLDNFAKDAQLIVISHSVQVINSLKNLIEVSKYDTDNMTKSKAQILTGQQRELFISKYLEI